MKPGEKILFSPYTEFVRNGKTDFTMLWFREKSCLGLFCNLPSFRGLSWQEAVVSFLISNCKRHQGGVK